MEVVRRPIFVGQKVPVFDATWTVVDESYGTAPDQRQLIDHMDFNFIRWRRHTGNYNDHTLIGGYTIGLMQSIRLATASGSHRISGTTVSMGHKYGLQVRGVLYDNRTGTPDSGYVDISGGCCRSDDPTTVTAWANIRAGMEWGKVWTCGDFLFPSAFNFDNATGARLIHWYLDISRPNVTGSEQTWELLTGVDVYEIVEIPANR